MATFNRFVEEHTLLFYALVVLALAVVGVVVAGDPLAALRSALGEALRPVR